MKKRFITILCCLTAIVYSCSEKGLSTYENGRNSIYFGIEDRDKMLDKYSKAFRDTTAFSFVDLVVEDTLVSLKVMVLGDVVNRDRKFSMEIVDTMTTAKLAVNYELESNEFYIPADSTCGYLSVRLLRTRELLDTVYQIGFRLKENEEFDLALETQVINKLKDQYINLTTHVLTFTDQLEKPRYFMDFVLGTYTVKKHLLINRLLDMNTAKWAAASPSLIMSIGTYMRAYLQDRIDEGNAIKEDDGSYMTVPGVILPE